MWKPRHQRGGTLRTQLKYVFARNNCVVGPHARQSALVGWRWGMWLRSQRRMFFFFFSSSPLALTPGVFLLTYAYTNFSGFTWKLKVEEKLPPDVHGGELTHRQHTQQLDANKSPSVYAYTHTRTYVRDGEMLTHTRTHARTLARSHTRISYV